MQAIAQLARLELTEDEITLFTAQLSQILAYFEHLQTADTSHIEPVASTLPVKTVLREDVAGAPLSSDEVLTNAADTQDGQFRVSAILDE